MVNPSLFLILYFHISSSFSSFRYIYEYMGFQVQTTFHLFLLVPYLKGMSQKFLECSMHPLEYLFHSDIAVFGIFIT